VNAVCPGPLDTAMPRAFFEGHPAKQAIADEMNRRNLLQRIGRAEDIVPLCLLLVSDDARLMTGSTVVIDAGMTL
jgi:NAD(P)-dependent dehydrogenase (short-subunit alcohol dehydrogenase family)